MKSNLRVSIVVGIFLFVSTLDVWAFATQESPLNLQGQVMQTKDLEFDGNDFIRNLGSDAYFSFRDLSIRRDRACAVKLDIEFAEPMLRPGLFQVFWHGSKSGFRESLKAFFIINQENSKSREEFVIPLCKLFHYSGNMNNSNLQSALEGLRIDYPSNKDIAIKFHSIELLDANEMLKVLSDAQNNTVILEPYERLHPNPATSLDVMIPKLFFILEEGLTRLWIDKWFLFAWLIIILLLINLILRSYREK